MLTYTIGGCTDGDKVNDTTSEEKAYKGCNCSIVVKMNLNASINSM